MAWNEPGGGRKPNDPWGGNKGDQGPPDLEEVFKKLSDQLSGIFGGKKGGGSGGGASGKGVVALIGLVLAGLAVVWFVSGWYVVKQAEEVVVLRFGEYLETNGAGLEWNPAFIDKTFVVNVEQVEVMPLRASMITKDINIVDIELKVQYRVEDAKSYVLRVNEPEEVLRHAAESALRHIVGGQNMESVINEGRAKIAIDVLPRLQKALGDYGTGLIVLQVNIEDALPPKAVNAAFIDVNRAQKDKDRYINQAETYKNGIVPEARGKAQRMLAEAEAYQSEVVAKASGEAARFTSLYKEYRKAPTVTRSRLYLDTMESVLKNSTKVLVDVDGGNNVLYLPIDQIIKQQQRPAASSNDEYIDEPANTVSQSNGRAVDRLRQRRSSQEVR